MALGDSSTVSKRNRESVQRRARKAGRQRDDPMGPANRRRRLASPDGGDEMYGVKAVGWFAAA
jgi:hypothetical protein